MKTETKATHTPGPWIADGAARIQGASPDGMYDICHLDRVPPHYGDAAEITQANANLLRAAPDLLAACRPVIAEAKQRADYMHDTWNPEAHVELTLTIAELRAIHRAIAKAEGQISSIW